MLAASSSQVVPSAESRLLKLLDPLSRSVALDHGKRSEIAPGEVIVREGEEGRDLYLILSGRVRVSVEDFGSDRLVATLVAGDFFGEMAMLTNGIRNATVTAEHATEVLSLSREVLAPLLEKNPGARALLSKVAMVRAERLMAPEAA